MTPAVGGPGQAPASAAQEQFWLATQAAVKPEAYNLAAAIHLDGPLDASSLLDAVRRLVAWQPALRTALRFESGRLLRQVNSSSIDVPLLEASAAEAPQVLRRFAAEPFDLAAGPVCRALLLRTGPARHVLALGCHHALLDGWSLGLLLPALTRLYAAPSADLRPAPAPEEPATSDGRGIAYWRAALEGAATRIDFPGLPAGSGWNAAEVSIDLDVTPGFAPLAAALYTSLRDASGLADLVIGVVAANRAYLQRWVVGCLANTLPLRLAAPFGTGPGEVLARTRSALEGMREHQSVSLTALVRALNPPRVVGGSPLFNVGLAVHNFPRARLLAGWTVAPGLTAHVEPIPTGAAQLDLRFVLCPRHSGSRLTCEYRADLFTSGLADGLLEAVRQAVSRLEGVDGRAR